MAGYICPFCQHAIASHQQTVAHSKVYFSNLNYVNAVPSRIDNEYFIELWAIKCPMCNKVSFYAVYKGSKMPIDNYVNIYPISKAKQFPDYIPLQIRQDYEEAYAILSLSPKASATLSRRCLQGMIRDFWGITKNNLASEIDALQDKIPAAQFTAIDALRKLGNIGAHMEKDVNTIVDIEPEEAQKLILLIEMLLKQWYIERHEQEKLYEDITKISEEKQEARHQ